MATLRSLLSGARLVSPDGWRLSPLKGPSLCVVAFFYLSAWAHEALASSPDQFADLDAKAACHKLLTKPILTHGPAGRAYALRVSEHAKQPTVERESFIRIAHTVDLLFHEMKFLNLLAGQISYEFWSVLRHHYSTKSRDSFASFFQQIARETLDTLADIAGPRAFNFFSQSVLLSQYLKDDGVLLPDNPEANEIEARRLATGIRKVILAPLRMPTSGARKLGLNMESFNEARQLADRLKAEDLEVLDTLIQMNLVGIAKALHDRWENGPFWCGVIGGITCAVTGGIVTTAEFIVAAPFLSVTLTYPSNLLFKAYERHKLNQLAAGAFNTRKVRAAVERRGPHAVAALESSKLNLSWSQLAAEFEANDSLQEIHNILIEGSHQPIFLYGQDLLALVGAAMNKSTAYILNTNIEKAYRIEEFKSALTQLGSRTSPWNNDVNEANQQRRRQSLSKQIGGGFANSSANVEQSDEIVRLLILAQKKLDEYLAHLETLGTVNSVPFDYDGLSAEIVAKRNELALAKQTVELVLKGFPPDLSFIAASD